MMTLIARLCTLCAMSALMQMALPQTRFKGSLRVLCGLLMIRLVVAQLSELGTSLAAQRDLQGLLDCLMR